MAISSRLVFNLPCRVVVPSKVVVLSAPTLLSHPACRATAPISISSSFAFFNSHSSFSARRALPSSSRSPSPSNFDDEGVVQDMEVYLNDLSLEYESVWDTKPVWCQPWTIVLTGCIAILLSWLTLHSVIATALVTSVIGAWWYIFLYSYPQAYAEMIAERRKRVSQGDEDTYGSKRLVK